jgi:hypothetical protein
LSRYYNSSAFIWFTILLLSLNYEPNSHDAADNEQGMDFAIESLGEVFMPDSAASSMPMQGEILHVSRLLYLKKYLKKIGCYVKIRKV